MRRIDRTGLVLASVVALMVAASFAAVPFYTWFCRVTGYGGVPTTAAAPDGPARPETVTVRFDANAGSGLGWEFRPMQRTIRLHLGETALIFYEARNTTDRVTGGTAAFNVTPYVAAPYFAKIECFCFTEQVLQPGERVEMPVSFFVDPAMLEDAESRGVREITLSYTMYPAPLPAEARADAPQPATIAN